MTHGNLNNSVRSIDVFFKNVSAEAYERPSLGVQAANEIVLNLIQERLVERDTPQDIKLTLKGLEKCKNDCY
jgi:predicted transcriptional regulator